MVIGSVLEYHSASNYFPIAGYLNILNYILITTKINVSKISYIFLIYTRWALLGQRDHFQNS